MSFQGVVGNRKSITSAKAAVASGKSLLILGPTGFGKTLMMNCIVSHLSDKHEVERSYADTWDEIEAHFINFSKRILDAPKKNHKRWFVIEDFDCFISMSKTCVKRLEDLLESHHQRCSIIVTCSSIFDKSLLKVKRRMVHIYMGSVTSTDLLRWGLTQYPNISPERMATLSEECLGSIHRLIREVSNDVHGFTLNEHGSPDENISGSKYVVAKDVLCGKMSMDEIEQATTIHGGHMFADTIFHNAPLVSSMEVVDYIRIGTRVVDLIPIATTTCDKRTRDITNMMRVVPWISCISLGESTSFTFTSILAHINARSTARNTRSKDAYASCVTMAEKVYS